MPYGPDCIPDRPRLYKRWRYPGVPIPQRLRSVYTDNPKYMKKGA